MEKKVLITVKTYPSASKTHFEVVCTAGITEIDNRKKFIRIYPVPFRKLASESQYKKYDFMEFDLEKAFRDYRQDSYVLKNLNGKKIGNLDTTNNWEERKRILLPLEAESMCSLERAHKKSRKTTPTLGLVKPRDTVFVILEDKREWTPNQKKILNQTSMFDDYNKPLEKVPRKFQFQFKCKDNNCKGHKKIITDWETFQLWRNCKNKALKSQNSLKKAEEIADVKTQEKYDGLIQNSNLYFFVGTVFTQFSWIIIGTFHPPKITNDKHFQQSLFG